MKARGVRLEIDISLSLDEINLLKNADLIGKVKIRDHEERIMEIPLVISTYLSKNMEYSVKMDRCFYFSEGLKYLPHSKRIFFNLGEEMYSELCSRGFTVSRFVTGGKLKLFDFDRREEVYR